MRIIILFLASVLTIDSSGQSNFANQVKSIFEDATNDFLKYTGTQKPSFNTSSAYYNTTIIIDGTTDNNIFKDQSGYVIYTALINDWVSKKEAKKIVDEYKKKLKDNFWPFKQQKGKKFSGALSDVLSENYIFERNNTTLAISIVSSGDNKNCIVTLHISHYP